MINICQTIITMRKTVEIKNNERLPTLFEVLSIVNGKAPILIEFKKLNKTQDQKFFKKRTILFIKKIFRPNCINVFRFETD